MKTLRVSVLGRRCAAGALLLLATPIGAQDSAKAEAAKEPKPYSPPPIFVGDQPLEFTIVGRYGLLRKQRTGEAPYHDGTVLYKGESGEVRVPVRLRARGIWRRKNCDIPPILMNFSKDSTKKTLFAHLDRARLTFPCRNNDDYEQFVLQEFALYRVQRLLSPLSFNVRLAKVTFIDAEKKDTAMVRWSFLSEQDDVFAERNGAKLVTTQGAGPDDLNPYESAFVGVWQYFVGNADYSIRALHNIVLVTRNMEYLPVARDYDFSGAVNARYAKPPEILRIRSVTERIMRGYCAPPAEYEKVFALFKAQKDSIYGLYSDPLSSAIQPKVKQETLKFFDEFYGVITDPKRAKKEIVESCLGRPA